MATNPYAYTADQLRQAFIEPLRSAMLVDDRFPLYSELLSNVATPEKTVQPRDFGDVEALLTQCRSKGLMCDVENRYQDAGKPLAHLQTSDLLVLDYHLVPGDDRDNGPALEILYNLAVGAHANLAVVYTAAPDLEEVKRSIAAYFYDLPPLQNPSEEYLQASEAIQKLLSKEDIEGYLLKDVAGVTGPTKGAIAAEIKKAGIHATVGEVIAQSIPDYLRENMKTRTGATTVEKFPALRFSRIGSTTIWIAFRNVFVVVMKKNQQKNIFDELEAALLAWNPSPLQLLLVHARNYLEKTGFLTDWGVIANELRHNAFFYHFLAGEEPSSEERMSQLFRNVFNEALQGLSHYVASYGNDLLVEYVRAANETKGQTKGQTQTTRLELAKLAARSEFTPKKEDVLHELNQFLSSVPFVGSHLKTGSIFRTDADTDKQYWVCVSADCSLVPRPPQDKKSWESDIYPNMPIVALRLELEQGKMLDRALENATVGRHLFVTTEEGRLALRVSTEIARQPRPEIFILYQNKVDKDKTFQASRLHSTGEPESKTPELKQWRFRAIAQLRSSYADRLLTQTGHYTTRIGVDFVSLASDEAGSDVAGDVSMDALEQ